VTTARPVLVVDDEPTNRRFLEAAIGALGYPAAAASTADEALKRLPALDPGLVLLDWRMPGLEGADAVRAVKALTDAPVVVCTAFVGPAHRERILPKPVTLDDLEDMLAQWFSARP
jgi:CheY-like chemotaxis protein